MCPFPFILLGRGVSNWALLSWHVAPCCRVLRPEMLSNRGIAEVACLSREPPIRWDLAVRRCEGAVEREGGSMQL